MIATASASVNCARSAMWSMSSPPSAGSEKMNIHLPSRWWPRYRTMCSCSPASAHSWHSLSYCRIAHALIRSVSSTFTATRSPDSDSASYTQPNAPLPSTPPVNSYLTPPKTTDWLASKPACTPRSSQLILGAPVAAMPTASALPCAGPAAPRLASQLGQHLYWIYERPATQIRQNTIASRDSATA